MNNKTPTNKFSRRNLLRLGSAGAAAALSPFIPVLNSDAQEVGVPKRIIFYVVHNGTIIDEFFPDRAGRDIELKRILAPLEPFKDRMTILGNVGMDPAPRGAHTGQGMLLTNTIPTSGRDGTGISVDQYIANQIGEDTPFGSVLLGNNSHWDGQVFLRGPEDMIPAENDPYRSFSRLFDGLDGSADTRARELILARRTSVIDGVLGDLNRFRASLAREDQLLIDLHLDSVRTLERGLDVEFEDTCGAPELMRGVDSDDVGEMPEISMLNNQIAQAALSCGLTRVIDMPVLRPVGNYVLSHLGIREGVHSISHGDARDAVDKFTRIHTYFTEELADLVTRLDATPEAGGTMLDNTLVVYCNPLANGHSKKNLPIAMIGGDWYFQTGYHRFDRDTAHGKWLVSLCHAMGVEVDTFGRSETSRGPLTGITV